MSLSPADSAAYWLRWQVLVCGALIALPAAAAAALLPRLRRAAPPLRAADLWVSCWARLHPGWLLAYRAFALAAAVALLARLLVGHGLTVFYFYTQWTFLLVTIYFAFATAISAHGCWVYSRKSLRKSDESHGFLNADVENRDVSNSISGERKKDETKMMVSYYEQIANERRAGFWGRCMQIIYQTSAGATMLTDVTFWGLLVPFFYRDKFGLALVTDGMHSLNAVFLLIDTVLNNMPFPWYRMAFFVFWSCAYVTFQWVLHACGSLSWWPYPFLDLSSSGAPIWYLGMAIAHIPCFFLYWLVVKAKHTYFPRMFPHAYVRTV
uniref:Protein rolling stone n=2 Tax=Zea mays TaxID=4577 RepID=A0A804MTP1_MAIZE